MNAKIRIGFLLILLCGLWGCGRGEGRETEYVLGSDGEAELVFPEDALQVSDLLIQEFSVDSSDYSPQEAEIYEQALAEDWEEAQANPYFFHSVGECIANTHGMYILEESSQLMAQTPYAYRIYRYDGGEDYGTLLYEVSGIFLLNEFCANDSSLYWVEYRTAEDRSTVYCLMQYDLTEGEVKCIQQREGGEWEELCLSVTDEYVTWYDARLNGSVEIAVYDVQGQKLETLEDESIVKYMPFERVPVTEGGITYFTRDEEGQIYVNRYDLETKKKSRLLIGNGSRWPKLAGCFSDSGYLGWFTDYYKGTYYFYNMKTGVLQRLESSEKLDVFSRCLTGGKLYINNSADGKVYVYDLETHKALCQSFPGTGLTIWPRGGRLYITVVGDTQMTLYRIQTDRTEGQED